MCFALFMVMLDNTVVNIALPAIKSSFGASISGLSWTVNAYTLVFGVLLVDRRAARRRVRPQAHVPGRTGGVHARLDRRRAVGVDQRARRLPHRPGRRSGVPDAGIAVDHHEHLQRPGSRPRAGAVGGDLRPGPRHGAGGGRTAGREGRLGVDLLPERPGRADRGTAHDVRRARVARRDGDPPGRPARHRHPVAGAGRPGAWARAGQRLRLDVGPDPGGVRRGRRRPDRVRPAAAAGPRPDAGHDVLPQPDVQRRQRRRVPGHVLDVRDVLLHHALHAERRGALAASDRRALPADDRADHRHGPRGRQAERPLRLARAPDGRA